MPPKHSPIAALALVAALAAALAMAACEPPRTPYYEYRHTPAEGWQRDDTLEFRVGMGQEAPRGRFKRIPAKPPRQAAAPLDLREDIAVRATQLYPYTALTLIVRQFVATKKATVPLRTDTIACPIANAAGGTALRQMRLHIADIRLADGDSLVVKISHNMRRECLPGIADIGLRLTRKH